MIDEQTKRSIETMCRCGLDFEALKGCFAKVEETELKLIYESIRKQRESEEDTPDIGISCNCS